MKPTPELIKDWQYRQSRPGAWIRRRNYLPYLLVFGGMVISGLLEGLLK